LLIVDACGKCYQTRLAQEQGAVDRFLDEFSELLQFSEAEPRLELVCPFLWTHVLEGLARSDSGKYHAEFAQYLQLDRLQAVLLIDREQAHTRQGTALQDALLYVMTADACSDAEVLRERLATRLSPIISLPKGQIADHLMADLLTCERIWNPSLPTGEDGLRLLSSIVSGVLDGSMRGRLLDNFGLLPNGRALLKVVSTNISGELDLRPVAARMTSFVDTLQTWSVSSYDPTLLGQVAEDVGGEGPTLLGQVAEDVGGEGPTLLGQVAEDVGGDGRANDGKGALAHLAQVSEMATFMDNLDARQLEYLHDMEDDQLKLFARLLASACNAVAVDFLRGWCEVCSADSIKDGSLTQNGLPDIAKKLILLSPLKCSAVHAQTWAALQVASSWCAASGAGLLRLALGGGIDASSDLAVDLLAKLRPLVDVSAITALEALSGNTSRLSAVATLLHELYDRLSEETIKSEREYLHTGGMMAF
jgi:hypothetical protein